VGVFFLAGIIILGVITFKVEDVGALLKAKVTMRARFADASGMKPGDAVTVAGLKVGEIQRIELRDDGVEVLMGIDKDVRIREDAIAEIAWRSLLGNRCVNISLGDPKVEARYLKSGDFIKTEPSIELTTVLKKIDRAASKFENMLAEGDIGDTISRMLKNLDAITLDIREQRGTIGKLISSDELYTKALSIADDIEKQRGAVGKLIGSDELYTKAMSIVDDLKNTATRVDKIVSENEERVTKIMKELEVTVPEAREAFATFRQIAKKVDEGEGVLPALINDKKMREDLRGSLDKISKSLDSFEAFARALDEGEGIAAKLAHDKELADNITSAVNSMKAIAERLEKGDGTLARLTRDDDMYDDIKKLIDDARETLRTIRDQVPVGTFAGMLTSAF